MKIRALFFLITIIYCPFVKGQTNDFLLDGYGSNNNINEFKVIRQNAFIDYEAPTLLGVMTKDSNNYFHCNFKVEKPQYVDIVAGRNLVWKVFVCPGGHQTFRFNDYNQLDFSGQCSQYSNCINELQYYLQVNDLKEPSFSKTLKMGDYIAKVDSFMTMKNTFIRNYEVKNKTKLPILVDITSYQYLHLLYAPFLFGQIKLTNLSTFHSNILSKANFNRDDLISDFFYTSAARDKYILVNTSIEDVQKNFSRVYKNIVENTHGRTKDYLISALVALYVNNSQENINHSSFLSTISNFMKNVRDSTFLSKIQNNYTKFLFIDKPLPSNVLDGTLLVKYDTSERVSLRDLLYKYSGKKLYLDFWASWCAPCREDIKESEKSKSYLKDNNIITIYISIDSDHNSWRRASKTDNIQNNQFLLEKGPKSVLGKFLTINSIPRYVMLNEKHELVNINAPRINESSYQKIVQL